METLGWVFQKAFSTQQFYNALFKNRIRHASLEYVSVTPQDSTWKKQITHGIKKRHAHNPPKNQFVLG
jgi:hypothetical protein